MYKLKEVDEIEVTYAVHISDLTRKALVELIERYQNYITNTDTDSIMGINDFLYEHPDLLNQTRASSDDILQAVCSMIDYVDGILDHHDITIPDSFRDDSDSEDQSRIYGQTYYNIEDFYKHVIYELMDEDEDKDE